MAVSIQQASMTKAFEGCLAPVPGRPGFFKPYYCPANVLTIGVGHTNHHEPKFTVADIWPESKCITVLQSDLGIFERHVDKIAPGLPAHKRDALVDWSFNTGGPASSSVWTYVKRGEDAEVTKRLELWVKAKGKTLPGLVRRRKANSLTYLGDYAAALRVAGAKLPTEGMPQRVDKPTVPVSQVQRATRKEQAAAATGAATTVGGKVAEAPTPVATTEVPAPVPAPVAPQTVSNWAVILGASLLAAMVLLIAFKWFRLQKDYA